MFCRICQQTSYFEMTAGSEGDRYVTWLDSGRPAEVTGTRERLYRRRCRFSSRPTSSGPSNKTTHKFLVGFTGFLLLFNGCGTQLWLSSLSAAFNTVSFPRGWRLASVTAAKHGGLSARRRTRSSLGILEDFLKAARTALCECPQLWTHPCSPFFNNIVFERFMDVRLLFCSRWDTSSRSSSERTGPCSVDRG